MSQQNRSRVAAKEFAPGMKIEMRNREAEMGTASSTPSRESFPWIVLRVGSSRDTVMTGFRQPVRLVRRLCRNFVNTRQYLTSAKAAIAYDYLHSPKKSLSKISEAFVNGRLPDPDKIIICYATRRSNQIRANPPGDFGNYPLWQNLRDFQPRARFEGILELAY
jgi:hypothetical protein